jgi:hypothetical protein
MDIMAALRWLISKKRKLYVPQTDVRGRFCLGKLYDAEEDVRRLLAKVLTTADLTRALNLRFGSGSK